MKKVRQPHRTNGSISDCEKSKTQEETTGGGHGAHRIYQTSNMTNGSPYSGNFFRGVDVLSMLSLFPCLEKMIITL